MDTITYYNARISPDLSALESTFGFITVSDWQELALTGRHLYVCIVAMHKAIQRAPQAFVDSVKSPSHPMAKNDPGALNLAMLHHHQASAAHSMQGQIEKVTAAEPDPRIIGNLALFLSVNIMESAYGRWHAHLQGAKALIDFWRHTDLDLPGSCGFGYFNLVMADIYSTTTSPSKHLSPSTVSYHSTYLDEIDRLQIFSFDSFTPVPKEMIITAISVNIHRARATNDTLEICEGIETSASGILEYARAFSPAIWAVEAMAALAETNPSPTPNSLRDVNNLDSWTALAQSFQSATVLYLIWSIPPDERVGGTEVGTWAAARSWAYATLTTAIHDLFERRQKKGSHYKFILWSMLMAGLEAIVLSDHAELVFLCSNLRILTVDLGVSAMHEAADLLEKTWTRFENREMELELHHHWDEIFADAPLFLM
ncbi:hypothetical protein VD0002_g3430 [Verticillium dahliae]|nr:hypothetical protein BJF96_g3202 [Verticillium dahliae]PNH52215.1 hypothetical protein VD0003_g5097 [Verticillium dahliae]PNH65662.1 hypothetical protein VD0002_g3430 [Verticillium dahliae]